MSHADTSCEHAGMCMCEGWFLDMCVCTLQSLEIQMWNAEYTPRSSSPPSSLSAEWKIHVILPHQIWNAVYKFTFEIQGHGSCIPKYFGNILWVYFWSRLIEVVYKCVVCLFFTSITGKVDCDIRKAFSFSFRVLNAEIMKLLYGDIFKCVLPQCCMSYEIAWSLVIGWRKGMRHVSYLV